MGRGAPSETALTTWRRATFNRDRHRHWFIASAGVMVSSWDTFLPPCWFVWSECDRSLSLSHSSRINGLIKVVGHFLPDHLTLLNLHIHIYFFQKRCFQPKAKFWHALFFLFPTAGFIELWWEFSRRRVRRAYGLCSSTLLILKTNAWAHFSRREKHRCSSGLLLPWRTVSVSKFHVLRTDQPRDSLCVPTGVSRKHIPIAQPFGCHLPSAEWSFWA